MSEIPEPEPPKKNPYIPGQPLPRLWKTEGEQEETSRDHPRKTAPKDEENAATTTTRKTKSSSKKGGRSKSSEGSPGAGGKEEKKVLLEETPALDTYESRRRARWIMGSLSVVCVLLMAWITYRMFLYDPNAVDIPDQEASVAFGPPEVRLPPDYEARFMLDRAHEYAKGGRTDQAVAMLKRVATVYKGTPTATEAKAALERPQHHLPLFPDGPAIVAERKPVELPPKPPPASGTGAGPPPSGVPGPLAAVPAQPEAAPPQEAQPPPGPGQAAVIVPANPAEPTPTPSNGENANLAKATIAPGSVAPRTLPPGFQAKLEAGLHESGWPRIIVSQRDDAPMVLVRGGTFTLGTDNGGSADARAHTVRLSTYYIDQHEVTNRQFRTFLDDTHYRGQPPGKWLTDETLRAQPESAPVVFANYKDAEAFAMWARKRLPTEAQWEAAARSPDGRRYPWGDQPARWSRPRAFHQVDPVMSFPEDVSPVGAFDMAGNVMEWTRDWFDPRYFEKMKDHVAEDPTGPPQGFRSIQRVVKGGSKSWTVSGREGMDLDKRLKYLGFRCSLAVEGPEAPAIITPQVAKPAASPTGNHQPAGSPPAADVPF
jgi:formylglycine-generating enzyme required for sulfatase activity